jgi:hypothetical protein
MPPWNEIWSALRLVIGPALGASLAVMLLVRLLAGEKCAPLAAALAVAAGFFTGNYFREAFAWRIDSDRVLNTKDLRLVLGWSLEGKPPPPEEESDESAAPKEEPPPIPPARYWLPWLAALAMLIDLMTRLPGMPTNLSWIARTLIAVLTGRLLTPAYLRAEAPWMPWLLTLTILVEWAVLCALTRQWKDGTAPLGIALCLAAAGVVMLHAHSARMTDLALLWFAALVGVAAVSWWRPGDCGAALAGAAVFLPGLLLNTQQETFSNVPERSFIFAGLAPLACLPMLLSFVARQQRWRRWILGATLPFAVATYAVILAARAEKLQF